MGNLYVVATPIGNLKDITERALETLKEVDYILCEDTRTSIKLLNYFNIKNKLISYHKFNEIEKSKDIIQKLKEGKNIALVSDAGTPCISDPGYILIKKAKKEHIKVYSIGGISAVISALSISGLDSSKFTFHGFFPKETKDRKNLLEEIKKSEIKTHIFYESPKRIITTLKLLSDNINNITVSVSKELSKINEKNYYGNINQVIKELEKDEKTSLGEYTFIIEKENIEIKQETISLEALLIDKLVKEHISLKEAVEKLNNEYKNLRKKDLYQASLHLKEILKRN